MNKRFFAGVLGIAFASGFSYGHLVEGIAPEGAVPDQGVVVDERFEQFSEDVVEEPKVFLEDIQQVGGYRVIRANQSVDPYLSTAHAAVVMDADTGTVLFAQNANQRRQVASTTKVMTALLAAEQTDTFDQIVTITPEMLDVVGTVVGCPRTGYCMSNRLVVGEKIRLKELMEAMLMNSANDAATAIAIHLGGTMENFVHMMNQRAKDFGLENTNFCTPSGLETDGKEHTCYSTASDMAYIASQTLQYDELWRMMRAPAKTIYSADGQIDHKLITTNQLIDQYPGLLGTKTGFTPLAGHSLLAAAQDPTRQHVVITVLLDDKDRWYNTPYLFDWAFDTFHWE